MSDETMPECGPEEPDRRDDPQWEQRAERWVRVEHETYDVMHFLGSEVYEGWAVVMRGTFEGLPDDENFLVVHRASSRAEAEMIAGSLLSILADVIEAETAETRPLPGLPPIAAGGSVMSDEHDWMSDEHDWTHDGGGTRLPHCTRCGCVPTGGKALRPCPGTHPKRGRRREAREE